MSATVGAPAAPPVGWLIACSLWLLPVFTGFGMTGWIGFAIVGVLIVRIDWIVFAAVWFTLLAMFGLGRETMLEAPARLAAGHFEPGTDIPLLVLYLVGVIGGVRANRVWLATLWGRRERGVRMFGWAPEPVAAPVPAAVAVPAAPVRDERRELLARVAADVRALVTREQQRVDRMLHAAAAVEPAPVPIVPPVRMTLLGLPSGPVDVRTASVDEIAAIPAIGPERAAVLVAARETHPLTSVDDVVQLLGLTAVDLVRARAYLRF